jgi:lambda repressor-like predicted transcriptional regulator
MLPPDVQQQHGLPQHAIMGALTRRLRLGEQITPDAFAANPEFIDYLHRFLEEQAPKDPRLLAEARRLVDGWVYIIDQRTRTPSGTVPPEDIIAAIQVTNGELVAGSYKRNDKHLLLSEAGFFRLGRKLHPTFVRTLIESVTTVST